MIHVAFRKMPVAAPKQLLFQFSNQIIFSKNCLLFFLCTIFYRKIFKPGQLQLPACKHLCLPLLVEKPGNIQSGILSQRLQLPVQRVLLHLVSQSAHHLYDNHDRFHLPFTIPYKY